MKRLFVLFILLLLGAGSAFAQGIAQAEQLPLGGELLIKGNKKYYIGGVRISRAEALEYLAPYDDVVRQINKGVRLRQSAQAVAIAGGGLILGGLGVAVGWDFDSGDDHDPEPHPITGGVIAAIGAAMEVASLGIHIAGNTAQKRAMSLYNDGTAVYSDPVSRDMRLSFVPTVGGLGLQLRF